MEVPEVKSVGRRTGRAELDEHAEGVHVTELEVDLKPSAPQPRARSSPTSARGSRCCRSASIVGQPISHRLDHMLSGVRAEIALKIFGDDLDALRGLAEELRAAARRDPRPCRPAGREAGAHPAARNPRRLRARRTLRRAAGGRHRGARAAVERPRRVAGRRRQPPLRRGAAPAGCRPHHAALRRPADRDAGRLRSARQIAEINEDRRPEPDPARERPAPHRRARQHRRHATWPRIVDDDPRGCWPRQLLPEGYFTQLEGTFQAQEEATRPIGLLSLVSLALIFAILYSRYRSAVLALIIMGSVPLALIGSVVGAVARRASRCRSRAWSASSR